MLHTGVQAGCFLSYRTGHRQTVPWLCPMLQEGKQMSTKCYTTTRVSSSVRVDSSDYANFAFSPNTSMLVY